MADQQTDLTIVIEAINKASSTLKQVEKDLTGLTKSVQADGAAATTASLGFGQLVAGVMTGTAAANIATSALRKLGDILVGIPKSLYDIGQYASEVSGIGIAMHVVANNAGITAEAVDKVRDSVVEQNVTTEASNRLMTDLIRNQLDYTQATELATAAQNIAVASGISSSETIERISEAVASGNTWNLRQLGLVEHLDNVYERYGETLGKTSDEMTEAERKQAIVNYVLQEGEKYAGAYDQAMQNASKVMRSTKDRVKEIAYSFGQVLEPALYEVSKAVYDAVNSIVKWAHEHEAKLRGIAKVVGDFMRGIVGTIKQFVANIDWGALLDVINWVIKQILQFYVGIKQAWNIITIFSRAVISGVNTLYKFGEAMYYISTAQFGKLKGVYESWADLSYKLSEGITGDIQDISDTYDTYYQVQELDLKKWWDSVVEIEGSGWEDRRKIAEEKGNQLTQKQKDTLDKMLHDIEKENRDYSEAVAKRAKDFEQSFEDLVITHRDKIQELTDDLASESQDYNKELQDLLSDYNEAMDEIEARHKEKTESIMEDMEDERKKAEEEIEKITEAYNEETSLIQKEGSDRLNNLKAQLDREKALGENANKEKVEALEQMIAYEEEGLSTSLDDKKAKYDEEVSDVNEQLNDKLEKIKKGLAEEDAAYADSFAKRKQQYEDDVADAKASYEEKRQELQKELDAEIAIRDKYAEDFKRIGDKIAADDITRLVESFKEEKAELEREHNERLADIKYQAFKGGEEFSLNFAAGIEAGYPAVKSKIDKINNDLSNIAKRYEDSVNQITWLPGYAPWETAGGAASSGGGAWQKGGLVTRPTMGMVGEAGAEVVLPLSFPKRMAMIMKSLGMGGESGGQVTQTFYVTINNPQDIDVLMERAGFAMKQGGGYS